MTNTWQPTADLEQIKQRANLLATIRTFFKNLNVLEVETPLLCQHAPTMPYIDPITVYCSKNTNSTRYLQTSPEYAMKRLLAAGLGDIFQICKAFRGFEVGLLHNPEFTILEWYRIGFDCHQLIQEIIDLLKICGINCEVCKISYREVFSKYINIDPAIADLKDLKNIIYNNIKLSEESTDFITNANKQECQELLFSHLIEPNLALNVIWCIYNYPTEQAALAKITQDPDRVYIAERFEIYINNIELANGYHELVDPALQHQRFLKDQRIRKNLKKPPIAIDPYLMDALEHGVPSCSGVAIGVDRLLLLITKAKSLNEILCFPWDRS